MNYQCNSWFRRIFDQPKLIIFAIYCIVAGLLGVFGLTIMMGWIRNQPELTRLFSSLPSVPFNIALSFFFLSLGMLLGLARNYRLSKIMGLFVLLLNGFLFFQALLHLNFATDFPIFMSTSRGVIPIKTSLAFCLLSASLIIFTFDSKKLMHLWLIAIFDSIIFTMSLSAIFANINKIDSNHILINFNKIDLLDACGFFVSSSVLLYLAYLKFRPVFPNFCMRWLSFLAFISLLWSTFSFYGALKNQELFFKTASLDHESLQMLKFTIHQSEVDKKSLKRISGRWNAIDDQDKRIKFWKKDAPQLINDIKPLRGLAILDPDKTLIGEISQKNYPIRKLIKQARGLLILNEETWHPIKNNNGKNILFAYFLLNFPKGKKGYLFAFYDLGSMIKDYPKFILKSEICTNILYQNKSLYFSHDSALLHDKNNEFIFSENKIDDWTIKMWSLSRDLKPSARFPDIFLTLGILMSTLIGSIFHLYQKFKRQSFLLVKANAAKSLFLANVSHEIRTPLHAIMGTTSLLEFTELNSRQEHLLHILKVSSNHLLDLINNLLDITKIESGNIALKYIPTDIRELCLDVISLFSEKAEEKGLNLRFNFDFPDERLILIPAREIRQIITNLLSNAIKYTEAGIVTLSIHVIQTEAHTGKLNINMSDTGIGIPHDKTHLIFEKFSQVSKNKNIKHSGTGLGLFISKLLVEEMNGQIRFESIEGQGSTFFASLPIRFVQQDQSTI